MPDRHCRNRHCGNAVDRDRGTGLCVRCRKRQRCRVCGKVWPWPFVGNWCPVCRIVLRGSMHQLGAQDCGQKALEPDRLARLPVLAGRAARGEELFGEAG